MKDYNTKEQTNKQFVLNAVLPDGTVLEEIYNPKTNHGQFAILKDGKITIAENYVDPESGTEYIPLVDNVIMDGVLTLPMGIDEYADSSVLLRDLERFIHKYMDVSPAFEKLAARYALTTWIYDQLPKVPYLRVIGEPGSGKSRFLDIMRALCYHSLDLGVNQSMALIFRGIHKYHGTALFDEANFHPGQAFFSDFVKVMNAGYGRNGKVGRVDGGRNGSFVPKLFNVFGPKILGAHHSFADVGLESRFLTYYTQPSTRDDLQMSTPDYVIWNDAIEIQKRLLGFRLRMIGKIKVSQRMECLKHYEYRLQEILMPLLIVTGENTLPEEVRQFGDEIRDMLIDERINSDQGFVFRALAELDHIGKAEVSPGEVSSLLATKGIIMDSRKIGNVLRILGLKGRRVNRGMVYTIERKKLQDQASRYGIKQA